MLIPLVKSFVSNIEKYVTEVEIFELSYLFDLFDQVKWKVLWRTKLKSNSIAELRTSYNIGDESVGNILNVVWLVRCC